jgi:hypothetical protein
MTVLKLLTMTCEVAAARETLPTGGAGKSLRRARVRRWPAARLLGRVWCLLRRVRVLWGVGNVVIVVEQGH